MCDTLWSAGITEYFFFFTLLVLDLTAYEQLIIS